jgi:signal transduction histidine kinase
MKNKIYIGLFCLILCFLAGGLYIGRSIDAVTEQLENIIILHKVEFLRENLLNRVVVVQADLLLKDTPHARKVDTFVTHVEEMHQAAKHCNSCHHEELVLQRIRRMEELVNVYMKKLSRIYTLRANETRLKREKENTFDLGQAVVEEVNTIVITSSHKTAQRINKARENISQTKEFLYWLMLIGPLIIIVSAFIFFRNFTRSVSILTTATRKIKEGQWNYRIQKTLKDEFRELATSFNEMAVSLKDQQHKLQQSEHLATMGELATGLAHEVKNPLAGIKISIEVLKNELDLDQENKEIFLKIINEINRIDSLLKNMLNYARPSKPHPELINIHEILEGIIKISEYSLKNPTDLSQATKDIHFTKDFDSAVPDIYADPAHMQQIFLNIVLNAIDAVAEQGSIHIKSKKNSEESMQVQISDSGSGLDPETIKMVFNPFYTTKSKGTGLGLAICKRLIEQHSGTISVNNNPEGGATFVITLPLKQKQESEEQEYENKRQNLSS